MKDNRDLPLTERQKEALVFMQNDFNQCFEHIRYYDNEVFDSLKYIFTIYTGVIGLSLGIYQFGKSENIDLKLPAIAMLMVILVAGLFFFLNIQKHRVNFITLTHYINEQRQLFFSWMQEEFNNRSGMYIDPTKPNYFNWFSSQLWYSYVIALLNGMLLCVGIFIIYQDWIWSAVAGVLLFGLQLYFSYMYLSNKDRNSKSIKMAWFSNKIKKK